MSSNKRESENRGYDINKVWKGLSDSESESEESYNDFDHMTLIEELFAEEKKQDLETEYPDDLQMNLDQIEDLLSENDMIELEFKPVTSISTAFCDPDAETPIINEVELTPIVTENRLIVYQPFVNIFLDVLSDSDTDSELSFDEINDGIPVNIADGVTTDVLYSYLLDTALFMYNNPEELLSFFEHIHTFFCRTIQDLNDQNKQMHKSLIDAYLKCRHNHFSSLCTLLLGVKTKLDTDADMTKYGSDKKPDLFIKLNDKLYIIEFTVGRSKERLEYQKANSVMGGKYDDLRKAVEIIENKETIYKLVYMVLGNTKDGTWQDFLAYFKLEEKANYFHEFERICMDNYDLIGPLLYLANAQKYTPNDDADEAYNEILQILNTGYDRPALSKIVKPNHDFFEVIMKKYQDMKKHICVISENKKCYIYFDLEHCYSKIVIDDKGFPLIEVKDAILRKDFASIYTFTKFFENGKPSNKQFNSDICLTIKCDRSDDSETVMIKEAPPSKSYYRSKPQHKDKYFPASYPGDTVKYDNTKVLFTENYIQDLVDVLDHEKIKKNDIKSKLLANNRMNSNQLNKAKDALSNALSDANKTDLPRVIKQSFIYPIITDELVYGKEVSPNFLEKASEIGKLTGAILKKCMDKDYVETFTTNKELQAFKEKYRDEISAINQKKKRFTEERGIKKFLNRKTMKDILTPEISSVLDREAQINKERSELLRKSSGKNKIETTVKINVKNRKNIYNQYKKEEFSHYGLSKGLHGYGLAEPHEINDLQDQILKLKSILISKTAKCSTDLINETSEIGPEFLTEHKKFMIKGYEHIMSEYRTSYLGKTNEFISRLCYTLFKFSVNNCNACHYMTSNLGYENAFLIVSGGKKLYKTGRTRPYRIIMPCNLEVEDIMGLGPNWHRFVFNGATYVVSPWSQMHESIVQNGIGLYRSVFSHLCLTIERNYLKSLSDLELKHLFPILLCYHNKRKTEGAMHNIRYLIVNQLGTYSNLDGIIKSFAYFNYTPFDTWMKHKMLDNFDVFAERMKVFKTNSERLQNNLENSKLIHIITGETLRTQHELTDMIYSTYLMVKAPVDKATEQANNLLPILEDVDEYIKLHGRNTNLRTESLKFDLENMDMSVYDDDFKYDPKYCQYLGHFTASFIGKSKKNSLHEAWEKIMDKPFTSIANSKGLRGKTSKTFFNKKGYEIIYDTMQKVLQFDHEAIKTFVSQFEKGDYKNIVDSVADDKFTLSDYCNDTKLVNAVFHVVDKLQRALGREIFVMDLDTKAYQQPLEQFFRELCTFFPNEMISIPSSNRPELVHSLFYDRKNSSWVKFCVKYTLDCRRWGPHAVFQKYVHFVYGMAPILPTSFLKHFFYVAKKMMSNKKIVTREYVIKVLRNNKRASKYLSLLQQDNDMAADAWSFNMDFSFIMGIYNYLSSLMHAAGQLVSAEVILRYNIKKYNSLVIFKMLCHSDDSACQSEHEIEETIEPSVILYDYLAKAANHMMSIKKAMIDALAIYLEILSILYICDQLLPLLSKVFGNMPFTPNDKGYGADIQMCASRMMEMVTFGATFSEAYLVSKLTEKHIQEFYGFYKINVNNPSFYLGSYDQHPIEVLIGGADSELYKHVRYNPDFAKIAAVVKSFSKSDDSVIPKLQWDMGSFINQDMKKRFPQYVNELMESWTIKNGTFLSSMPSYLWFLSRLYDKSFYSSLVNEPSARRLGRIYGASNRDIVHKDGRVSAKELSIILNDKTLTKTEDLDVMRSYLDSVNYELCSFYNACDTIRLSDFHVVPLRHTLKPVRIFLSSPKLNNVSISPAYFVCWAKERKYLPLFGIRKNLEKDCETIASFIRNMGVNIEDIGPSDLYMLVRKLLGNENISIRILSYVKSDNRFIHNLETIFQLLETNSLYEKVLELDKTSVRRFDKFHNLLKAQVPNEVMKIMSASWLKQICKDLNVDVFKDGMAPDVFINSEKKKISPNWLELIEAIDLSKKVRDLNYWAVWIKPQTRLGNNWVGVGQLFVKLPECSLQIKISGNLVQNIIVDVDRFVEFSQTSSWFMQTTITPSIGFLKNFSDSSSVSPNLLCLGHSQSNGSWGIGYPRSFDMVYIIETKRVLSNDILNRNAKPLIENGNIFALGSGHSKYKMVTFTKASSESPVGLREFFDINKIRANMSDKSVQAMNRKLSIITNIPIKIGTDALIRNIQISKLYNVLHTMIDEFNGVHNQNIFVRALMTYKKRYPDFGFPDMQSLCEMNTDAYTLRLPLGILKALENLGMPAYPLEVRVQIQNEILDAMNNPQGYNADIISALSNYGETAVKQALMTNLTKDFYALNFLKIFPSKRAVIESVDLLYRYVDVKISNNIFSDNLLSESKRLNVESDKLLCVWATMFLFYPAVSYDHNLKYYKPINNMMWEILRDDESIKLMMQTNDREYGVWSTFNFLGLETTKFHEMFSRLLLNCKFLANSISAETRSMHFAHKDADLLKLFKKNNQMLSKGVLGSNPLGNFEVYNKAQFKSKNKKWKGDNAKKTLRNLKLVKDKKPGNGFIRDFNVIHDTEEYDCIPPDSDYDELEYIESETIDDKITTYYYAKEVRLDWHSICSHLGSAPFVFLEVPYIPLNFNSYERVRKVYRRTRTLNNYFDKIAGEMNYLLVFMPSNNWSIHFDDFEIVSPDKWLVKSSKCDLPSIKIGNESYDIKDITTNDLERLRMLEPFQNVKPSADKLETIIKTYNTDKIEDLIPGFQDSVNKIEKIKQDIEKKKKNNAGEKKESIEKQELKLDELINAVLERVSIDQLIKFDLKHMIAKEDSIAKAMISVRDNKRLFKEPLNVLTDAKLIGELTALIPEINSIMLDGSCSLSMTDKKILLKFISIIPNTAVGRTMKFVLKCFLASIRDGSTDYILYHKFTEIIAKCQDDKGEEDRPPPPLAADVTFNEDLDTFYSSLP